jgi:c-di-GMP-binding flagellar brake protein YcgR
VQSIKNNATSELQVWEKLRILVGDERDAGVYVARTEEFINGGIIITNPEFVSGNSLLRNDIPVIVQITRQDAAYQFHSRIRVQGDETTRRFILAPPRGLQRVQRRMFARVDFPTRVVYAPLPTDSKWQNWEKDGVWCETNAVNLSAGGLLMESSEDIKVGMLVALQISELRHNGLPTDYIAVCRRSFIDEGKRCAGVELISGSDLGRHLSKGDISRLPAKYKQFDRHIQDRLVTFLFQKQIELRQKGLI